MLEAHQTVLERNFFLKSSFKSVSFVSVWENFKFILGNAVEIGIYKPIDYKKKPKGYCGMTITDNPYYDL